MQRERDVGFLGELEHRVPMIGMPGRQADAVREFGEGPGLDALVRGPLHLLDGFLDVPVRQTGERNLPAGVVGAPLLDDEIVVGPCAFVRQCEVLRLLERGAGEATEVGEAQLCVHTLGVHVLDAVRDVVAPGQHVVVGPRIHSEILRILTGYGVEGEVTGLLTLVDPPVVSVLGAFDARGVIFELRRHTVGPHPWVFDDVVVDRNDLYIVA
ncbi:hypothetical protein VF34_04886 [Rhodococcus sp. PML026]|nr:hypothetical protein VF34_04886 [Rhodococcus sp. PML026]